MSRREEEQAAMAARRRSAALFVCLSWNTVSQVLPPDIPNWDLYRQGALAEEGSLEMAPIKPDGKDVLRNGSVSLRPVNSRIFEASPHKQRRLFTLNICMCVCVYLT